MSTLNPDSPAVRTDVPLELHPDIIGKNAELLNVENTIGRYILADARNALSAAYAAYGNLNDAEKALKEVSVPTGRRMSGGRITDHYETPDSLIDAADKALRRVSAIVDARAASITAHVNALEKRVTTALDDSSAKTPMAAEIRSHIKSLKKSDRLPFILRAIREGDKRSVAAILAAPSYLSGLDGQMYYTVHAEAAEKFCPIDHEQLQIGRKLLDRVHNAGSKVLGRYVKVVKQKDKPNIRAHRALDSLEKG